MNNVKKMTTILCCMKYCIFINIFVIPFQITPQNFPNTFSPGTTISYNLPEVSIVILKVYDVLGNEIETLVNEEKSIGSYEVKFDEKY